VKLRKPVGLRRPPRRKRPPRRPIQSRFAIESIGVRSAGKIVMQAVMQNGGSAAPPHSLLSRLVSCGNQ
jgi:hypothetical protein